DSVFARPRRAVDLRRSKPFLILVTERDMRRATKSLNHEFREIQAEITILSFVEMRKIHENLHSIAAYLPKFLKV
ncbi:MAG: hypothetical protein ACR2IA_04095, partial [Pyrinomonadaceae bacterium]